jgi:hypothetical protein
MTTRALTVGIADTAVMTRRYLHHYLRKPSLLAIALVQPVLFVLLWTYVFSGAIQTPGGVDYVDYLMPGLFILAIAFGSANTGVGLADDLARGLLDRFRALPMPGPPCWSGAPWPTPPATPSSSCSWSRSATPSASASTPASPRPWPPWPCHWRWATCCRGSRP